MDDPPGETPASEDLVLRLVVVRLHRVDGEDLLNVDNLWDLLIDLNGGGRPIDGLHRKCSHGRGDQNDQEKGDDNPPPLLDDFPVIPQVDLFLFLKGNRRIPRISRRR